MAPDPSALPTEQPLPLHFIILPGSLKGQRDMPPQCPPSIVAVPEPPFAFQLFLHHTLTILASRRLIIPSSSTFIPSVSP